MFENIKLRLEVTSGACPEQYSAFTEEGEEIGYLRLRHGYFRADYRPTGQTVYDAYPAGDGCFHEDERDYYLGEACDALIKKHFIQKENKTPKDTFYY